MTLLNLWRSSAGYHYCWSMYSFDHMINYVHNPSPACSWTFSRFNHPYFLYFFSKVFYTCSWSFFQEYCRASSAAAESWSEFSATMTEEPDGQLESARSFIMALCIDICLWVSATTGCTACRSSIARMTNWLRASKKACKSLSRLSLHCTCSLLTYKAVGETSPL